MKIFILEDMEDRIDTFKSKFSKHGIVSVYSLDVENAIKNALEFGPFDLFLLDHDLAPEHYGSIFDPSITSGEPDDITRAPDGHDFTKWLIKHPEVISLNAQIYIHSLNDAGARNMARTLVYNLQNITRPDIEVTRMPYHLLIQNLNVKD